VSVALLLVTRHAEFLRDGRDKREAAGHAVAQGTPADRARLDATAVEHAEIDPHLQTGPRGSTGW
jgi:hypothetical protein